MSPRVVIRTFAAGIAIAFAQFALGALLSVDDEPYEFGDAE